MANKEPGYVYILTNPSFREDWVKIGMTQNMEERLKTLDNTSVPLPFKKYATLKTIKYQAAEKLVHHYIERFTDLRIRDNREFFNVRPEDALKIFREVAELLDDAEIEVHADTPQKKAKRPKKEQPQPVEHIFYCTRAGSNGKGYFMEETEEFVVLAGSELRSGECDSLSPQSVEKRQAFIESNCTQTDGKIILNADYTFPSPSAAAAMVVGGSSNGWTRWKDADNKTLDEVYRKK